MTKPTKWLCTQRRIRSASAQADLGLHLAQSFCCFCHVAAHNHETMVLFVLHKLILQTCMRSHPVGLDVWFLVGPFVYFMCVNSEGSGETVQKRRLTWAFAGRLCDKYHNLMSWLIFGQDGGYSVHPGHTLIWLYNVCHPICTFWMHYNLLNEIPHCLNFRIITANYFSN